MGRPPKYSRPTKPAIVRFDPDLHEALMAHAQAESITFTDLVDRAARNELKRIARATRSATNAG